MSTQRKTTRSNNATMPLAGQWRAPVAAILLLGSGDRGVPWCWVVAIGARGHATDSVINPRHSAPQLAPMAATVPGMQQLQGTWRRPDGGYVVDIRTVEDGGTMDVAYFNPWPIKVSKAEASQEGATTKVFLELLDVHYPGSTYTLTYDLARDQLQGVYYQAALQQRFDVVFVRMP